MHKMPTYLFNSSTYTYDFIVKVLVITHLYHCNDHMGDRIDQKSDNEPTENIRKGKM